MRGRGRTDWCPPNPRFVNYLIVIVPLPCEFVVGTMSNAYLVINPEKRFWDDLRPSFTSFHVVPFNEV